MYIAWVIAYKRKRIIELTHNLYVMSYLFSSQDVSSSKVTMCINHELYSYLGNFVIIKKYQSKFEIVLSSER